MTIEFLIEKISMFKYLITVKEYFDSDVDGNNYYWSTCGYVRSKRKAYKWCKNYAANNNVQPNITYVNNR